MEFIGTIRKIYPLTEGNEQINRECMEVHGVRCRDRRQISSDSMLPADE